LKEIIKLSGVNKAFNNQSALNDINITVKEGSLISVIGSSGCGKTTLLRTIAMIEYPNSGDFEIDDIKLSNDEIQKLNKKVNKGFKQITGNFDWSDLADNQLRKKIKSIRLTTGFLFQNLNLFPNKSVIENMTLAPVIVKGLSKEKAESEAIEILKKLDMLKYKDRYPNELSGGQSQRAAIARSLAMNPKIMLYDEPTSALDPALAIEILNIMNDLKSEGITQMLVTHAMNFAKKASDKVIYMHNGCIVEFDSPDIIFNNPKENETRKYLEVL
jgi:polar amino acid transport system ATP-binding protein